jgi:2-dehydropantoate 2-reductase
MKIAVVGAGALGSFYGAKLLRAGRDVRFLVRSDFEIVRQRGVRVLSADGDLHVNPRCARTSAEIGPVDLVIIGLKTTANGEFSRLLPPLVGPHTAVLTLQNGLGNEEALEAVFSTEQILGGLCFVCLNRTAPGVIRHISGAKILLGEFRRWPEPRTHEIAAMFRHAGVPCEVSADIIQAHWRKLVWNVPFNGLGVAGVAGYDAVLAGQLPTDFSQPGPVLPTDALLGDARWRDLVRTLMHEVIAGAAAVGHPVEPEAAEFEIQRTDRIDSYRASTLIDFAEGRPMELESLFLHPLREAERAGVAAPRWAAMARVLVALRDRFGPAMGGSGRETPRAPGLEA